MPGVLDSLLEEAERQPFEGWDFSWLAGQRQPMLTRRVIWPLLSQ